MGAGGSAGRGGRENVVSFISIVIGAGSGAASVGLLKITETWGVLRGVSLATGDAMIPERRVITGGGSSGIARKA